MCPAGPLPIMQTRVLSSSMAVEVAVVEDVAVAEEDAAAAADVVARPRKWRALKRKDFSLLGVRFIPLIVLYCLYGFSFHLLAVI